MSDTFPQRKRLIFAIFSGFWKSLLRVDQYSDLHFLNFAWHSDSTPGILLHDGQTIGGCRWNFSPLARGRRNLRQDHSNSAENRTWLALPFVQRWYSDIFHEQDDVFHIAGYWSPGVELQLTMACLSSLITDEQCDRRHADDDCRPRVLGDNVNQQSSRSQSLPAETSDRCYWSWMAWLNYMATISLVCSSFHWCWHRCSRSSIRHWWPVRSTTAVWQTSQLSVTLSSLSSRQHWSCRVCIACTVIGRHVVVVIYWDRALCVLAAPHFTTRRLRWSGNSTHNW